MPFIFRSIKLKIQKYLAAFYSYLFYLAFDLPIYYNLSHVRLSNLRRRTPEGIDNPFNTSGCEDLLSVCRGCLRCFAWFSYWYVYLGFFTEGNTYRCYAASSLPLWGNTDVASSRIMYPQERFAYHKRPFWPVLCLKRIGLHCCTFVTTTVTFSLQLMLLRNYSATYNFSTCRHYLAENHLSFPSAPRWVRRSYLSKRLQLTPYTCRLSGIMQ